MPIAEFAYPAGTMMNGVETLARIYAGLSGDFRKRLLEED